jgi:HK97 family phage portal protein
MKIIDWLHGLFRPPEAGVYNIDSYRRQAEEHAALDAFALFTAVHLISSLLSTCEFRTFRRGTELHGEEWYSLNVRPNKNQNAVEWKRELISRVLLSGDSLCIQLPDGQRIIADGFSREEFAAAPDRFTQVSRAGYTFERTFLAGDVIYLRSAVNARAVWMQTILGEYEKLMGSAAKRFDQADGERGILKISAVERGKADFAEKFNQLMNDYFKGYFASKNAVLPLFDGYEYTSQSGSKAGTYTNDLSAIKTLADEAISRAAQVFGIPPSYIRGDAAGIADAQAAMMTNCIKPLAAMLSAELTGALYDKRAVQHGGCIFVDTGNVLHHDLIGSSTGIDKLMGAGWTINEINRALGQPKNNDPDCDTRFVTKNYGELRDIAEGGEENA